MQVIRNFDFEKQDMQTGKVQKNLVIPTIIIILFLPNLSAAAAVNGEKIV